MIYIINGRMNNMHTATQPACAIEQGLQIGDVISLDAAA